uniref:Uncharacterized protein n=1 Tax=viral metagenome TaxID=1070528 RepID=A0A6C0LYC2_9ZZZZ
MFPNIIEIIQMRTCILKYLFKLYIQFETFVRSKLPQEKRIYLIKNNQLVDVTIKYYICMIFNVMFSNTQEDYIVEYRNQNRKKLITNGNYLDIINKVKYDNQPILRIPLISFIMKINDKILNYEDKKKLLHHEGIDKLAMLYFIYYGEVIDTLEVIYKGKLSKWSGEGCKTVTINDILT